MAAFCTRQEREWFVEDMVTRYDGMTKVRGRVLWLGIGLLAISACGGKDRVETTSPPPVPEATPSPTTSVAPVVSATPDLSPSRRLALAADLLDRGMEAQARVELLQLLADKPDEERASDMLRQIDTDATQLYGTDSFAYQLKGRENLVDVARRYMGSLYRFYGLAKYNGIAVPNQVEPGRTIMIPGRARAPEPPPPSRQTPRPPRRTEAAPATPEVSAPVRPVVDRGRAQRLRRAGLQQLSAGSIDRAVALLGQAAALDPGNGAIRGDLARAQRIQAGVRR